ncbi:hypothetical protein OROHE_008299 [Orobanche hederae]
MEAVLRNLSKFGIKELARTGKYFVVHLLMKSEHVVEFVGLDVFGSFLS